MRALVSVLAAAALAVVLLLWPRDGARHTAAASPQPSPGVHANATATLAGGCFWCLEAVFSELDGVESVTSGYCGGSVASPSYELVSTGTTGHAETVQVRFDSTVVSYRDLIRIFFTVHNPTTLNRQGPDVGSQYRSAIFYHSPEQKRVATEVILEVTKRGIWQDPIVTQVSPFTAFYPAEDYHQQYFARNPDNAYCAAVIAPKVLKFREEFAGKLRTKSR